MLTVFTDEALVSVIVQNLPSNDQWRLRSSSKEIAVIMDRRHIRHHVYTIRLSSLVEKASRSLYQVQGTRAFSELLKMVNDRVMYDRMGPLRKWFKDNRVFMDEGGFYTRVSDTKRVRVGLWETGVDFVMRPKAFGFVGGRWVRFRKMTYAVLRDGFETYDPAEIAV
jgi:hypothetical protein